VVWFFMTKLLEQAIAKVRNLSVEEQDAVAVAILSLSDGDASAFPIDDATRAAILEGLAEAERGEYVPDEVVAAADKRHGI
jgi:predicted transcriptional regulator